MVSGDVVRALAPMQATVAKLLVSAGDTVAAGTTVALLESMKMEHPVVAPSSGTVEELLVAEGDTVERGAALLTIAVGAVVAADALPVVGPVTGAVRPELAELETQKAFLADANRTEAVARRHATGHRTARENIADLCDPGTFVEYGGLVIAAQRARRDLADLIERTPGDGLVGGIGRVNGDTFGEGGRCAALSYDYMVLAGTQGHMNHRKKDRLFELVERLRLPVVLFCEGGGGRPGDTDGATVTGLDTRAFELFGGLSGLVPSVGIVSGRCFAGNAALLGASDVIIATKNASIGMGGPAMIEGGGLGTFAPDEVGPLSIQVPSGVVDIAVEDEREAVAVAKRYLSYFQGALAAWSCADQQLLRSAIPENRLRVYDVHNVVRTLADTDSVLELRPGFGTGVVTALARIEGGPLGIVASNPMHLGGAIDAPGADKAARFLQLCDAFSLPVLYLCDTPGIMVGPDAERTGLVRHSARLFVNAATMTVPFFTIVLRKGYGLGAQAMAGGSFHAGFFTVSWPTGEFGAMGLEGAIRLGYRRELEAADPEERKALFERMVAAAYQDGKAINTASYLELDDVIDPADSRRWIASGLQIARTKYGEPPQKRRRFVDTW